MQLTDLISTVGSQLEMSLILAPAIDREHAFSIRIRGFESPSGFALSVKQTPLSWKSQLVFDPLGGQWAAEMRAFHEAHPAQSEVALLEANQLIGTLSLNFDEESPDQAVPLPNLMAQTKYPPTADPSIYLSKHLVGVFFVVRTFLYQDEISPAREDSTEEGEIEGAVAVGARNRYERSRANRAMAIQIHGSSCSACGVNPGRLYGVDEAGMIHVHHLVPLANMSSPMVVNPRTDLVPLCPNCHSFAHKKNPPYTPQEISEAVQKNRIREDE